MTKRNEDEEVDDRFVQRAPLKRSDRPRVDAVGADRRTGGGPMTSSLWDRTVGQIAVTAAGRVYKRDTHGRFARYDSHGKAIKVGKSGGKSGGESGGAELQDTVNRWDSGDKSVTIDQYDSAVEQLDSLGERIPGDMGGSDDATGGDVAKNGPDRDKMTPEERTQARKDGEVWDRDEFPMPLDDSDPRLYGVKDMTGQYEGTRSIQTPERNAMRAKWEEAHFQERVIDGEKHPKPEPVTEGKPTVMYMGGGGASGKGYVGNQLTKDGLVPEKPVRNDPDNIKMESIPEFKILKAAGDARAASVVHEESSDVAKGVLARARDGNYNIVNDVTLGNKNRQKALDEFEAFRQSGYDVDLVGVTVEPVTAVTRNNSRAGHSGRYVPEPRQLEAHREFSNNFEAYAAAADTAKLYDTNHTTRPGLNLIAEKKRGGELEIYDQVAFDAFRAKGNLNPNARGPNYL